MLAATTEQEIGSMVRSGFYGREELIEIFSEELYAPGELDADEVEHAIDTHFAEYEREKQSYPAITDCDRLDTAFHALNDQGIVALHNAGYTQSDGYGDIREIYKRHANKASVFGYCFYHGQDLQRALSGGGLFFAFGPINPADEQTVGGRVGTIVRAELQRAGLVVEWNGTFDQRLSVANFLWQKH